jgi:hypothetical protein
MPTRAEMLPQDFAIFSSLIIGGSFKATSRDVHKNLIGSHTETSNAPGPPPSGSAKQSRKREPGSEATN